MQTEIIDGVLVPGIWSALPSWSFIPIAALQRETRISLAKVLLEERRLLASARIRWHNKHYSLRLSALESTQAAKCRLGLRISNRGQYPVNQIHGSRVQRTSRILPETEAPPPLLRPTPPPLWLCGTDENATARITMKWLSRLPHNCLYAYSDESSAVVSYSAWGFAVYFSGTTINLELSYSGPLAGAEVYDAEVHGAMAALEVIIMNLGNRNISEISVILDNAGVAEDLRTGKTTSSHWRIRRFRRRVKGLITLVRVNLIPGHEGIPGNEVVDQLAREALNQIIDTKATGILTIDLAGRKARAMTTVLYRD